MKNERPGESWFQRFMRWAEGTGEQSRDLKEEQEQGEFIEYLEYLDAHERIDFRTYHQLRMKERAKKGLPVQGTTVQEVADSLENQYRRSHSYKRGWLRRSIYIYRGLSCAIALVLMVTFFVVAMELPAFGDIHAPAVNEVSTRYLERGLEETGAVNAVAGMILDYRAFDTFGESSVLFVATMSVVMLLRHTRKKPTYAPMNSVILTQVGRLILPMILLFGIYVVLNGHLSPGGGFSGGTVLGCALILSAMVLGQQRMDEILPADRITKLTVGCLLAYGIMKGYSFFTGANHIGWEIPKGIPGAIFSAGFILPLNICVGVIVACTMYTFYTLFVEREA